MDISRHIYSSGLIPAAPVSHGYKNFWIRDGYYVGLCCGGKIKEQIWQGVIDILDRYKWKLEIHAKKSPHQWYEFIHIRYTPEGYEIGNEHWMHNQFDCIANALQIAIDKERFDLAALLVDYLHSVNYSKRPAAGAWEDRNTCDAYTLASCIATLQNAKVVLPEMHRKIDKMVKQGCRRLYGSLLPFATKDNLVCLSLLGVIWPYDMAGPYRQDIIDLVKSNLMREPFGFIRYKADSYDGEGFGRKAGTEIPWLLGDCFMQKIEPNNPLWTRRLDAAKKHFGFIPEGFFPETMKANRNSPLLWAEAMYQCN
jgi:hypothetical protein